LAFSFAFAFELKLGVPHSLRFFSKGCAGFDFVLKKRLERRYGKRDLHFIT
jgi:hypothetical protein